MWSERRVQYKEQWWKQTRKVFSVEKVSRNLAMMIQLEDDDGRTTSSSVPDVVLRDEEKARQESKAIF